MQTQTETPVEQVPQPASRIVESLLGQAQQEPGRLAYNDYCDWHDTCNSND